MNLKREISELVKKVKSFSLKNEFIIVKSQEELKKAVEKDKETINLIILRLYD